MAACFVGQALPTAASSKADVNAASRSAPVSAPGPEAASPPDQSHPPQGNDQQHLAPEGQRRSKSGQKDSGNFEVSRVEKQQLKQQHNPDAPLPAAARTSHVRQPMPHAKMPSADSAVYVVGGAPPQFQRGSSPRGSEGRSMQTLMALPSLSQEPSGQLSLAGSVIVHDGSNISQLQSAVRLAAARQSFQRISGSTPLISPTRSEEVLIPASQPMSDTPEAMSPPPLSPIYSRPPSHRLSSPTSQTDPVLQGIAAAATAGAYSAIYASGRMALNTQLFQSPSSHNFQPMAGGAISSPGHPDMSYIPFDPYAQRVVHAGSRGPAWTYTDLLSQPPPIPQYQLPTAWAAPSQPSMQAMPVPRETLSYAPPSAGMYSALMYQPNAAPQSRPLSAGHIRPSEGMPMVIPGTQTRVPSPAGHSVSRAWGNYGRQGFASFAQPHVAASGSPLRTSVYSDLPGQPPWQGANQ